MIEGYIVSILMKHENLSSTVNKKTNQKKKPVLSSNEWEWSHQ